jgi:hypothetical protein
MTMTTHMRMLSSLALTAAALVTLSSDALARGGMGGGGGMRSFHVARAPTVVSRVRTTSTAAVRSRTTSATSHTKSSGTKTSHAKANHCKKGCDSSSDSKTNPGSKPNSGSQDKDKDKSAEGRHHHRHRHDKDPSKDPSNWMPPAPASGSPASAGVDPSQVAGGQVAAGQVAGAQVTASQGSGGSVRKRRNVEDRDRRDDSTSPADGDTKDSANPNSANPNPEQDGNGTRAPQQAPAQELIGNYPVAVIDQGGGGSGGSGGTISKENQIRTYPIEAPTVSTGIGAAPAPVAVDPPGCVYERSVRKPPGGGLQRVILKICPDA